MYKKIISSLLVFALLNLVGCYSNVITTPNQYKKHLENGEIPSDISVRLYNLKEYRFAVGRYNLMDEFLYGNGYELVNNNYKPFEGSIRISQIQSVQFEKKDQKKTNQLVYGMVLLGLIVAVVVIAGAMVKSVGEGIGKAFESMK